MDQRQELIALRLSATLEAHPMLRDLAEARVTGAGIDVPAMAQGEDGTDLAIVAVGRLAGAAREIAAVASRRPGTPVLVLVAEAAPPEPDALVSALRAGADGILPLTTGPTAMRRASQALVRGESVLSRGDVASVVAALRASDPIPQGRVRLLSPRELLVLRKLAAGRTTAQIADELHVTPSAVRAYTSRAVGKLRTRGLEAALELVSHN